MRKSPTIGGVRMKPLDLPVAPRADPYDGGRPAGIRQPAASPVTVRPDAPLTPIPVQDIKLPPPLAPAPRLPHDFLQSPAPTTAPEEPATRGTRPLR